MKCFGFLVRSLLIVCVVVALGGVSAWGRTLHLRDLRETTGNPKLDKHIAKELRRLEKHFGVRPHFFIYNDRGRPNAAASLRRLRPNSDGTVVFGRTLLVKELYRGRYASIAVAGIMAHEYAHILQLRSGVRNVRVVHLELHADCMAGWYLGRSRGGRVRIQPFAQSLYEKGDYAYWNRKHHGTPRQRIHAMIAGYRANDLGRRAVYKYCISVATKVQRKR